MTKKIKEQVKQANEPKRYSKSAFVDAEKNSKERILLQTLLNDDQTYTKDGVTKLIKNWKSKIIKNETEEVKA